MLSKLVSTQKYLFNTARTISNVRNAHSRCIYNYGLPTYYCSNLKPQQEETNTIVTERTKTAGELILADFALGRFITNVYSATGGGIAASLAIAKLVSMASLAATPIPITIGALMSFSGVFTFHSTGSELTYKQVEGKTVPYVKPSFARQLSYFAIYTGNGLMLSKLVLAANLVNPAIIPMSIALTALTFGGASLYAYNKPLGSFSKYGGFLSGGLLGLIGMSLMSGVSYLIMGPTPLSMAFWRIEPYIAIAVFSGLIGHDTHQAVENYKPGDYDHFKPAVLMYYNVITIFTNYIHILLRFYTKK